MQVVAIFWYSSLPLHSKDSDVLSWHEKKKIVQSRHSLGLISLSPSRFGMPHNHDILYTSYLWPFILQLLFTCVVSPSYTLSYLWWRSSDTTPHIIAKKWKNGKQSFSLFVYFTIIFVVHDDDVRLLFFFFFFFDVEMCASNRYTTVILKWWQNFQPRDE